MPQFPSKLTFYAYAQYAPRGTTHTSLLSRKLTYAIKQDGFVPTDRGNESAIDFVARRIAQRLDEHPFLRECLGPDVALIPVPRSSPLRDPSSLWPTRRIAERFVANGLGALVLPLLERKTPVQRSSQAEPGQRPLPNEHFESVEALRQSALAQPQRITIVDDVVTRGSTFVGLYPHVLQAFPDADICCFAVVRTISKGDVEDIRSPVKGEIIVNAYGRPTRNP